MTTIDEKRNPIPFAGDKGFIGQAPAKLTRLLLTYEALAGDDDTPAGLRDYASVTVAELRRTLDRAVAA